MMDNIQNVWIENAKDTYKSLAKIEPAKITKEQFLLYGAACGILTAHNVDIDDLSGFVDDAGNMTPKIVKAHTGKPSVSTDVLVDGIKDELDDALKYYKFWEETRDTEYLNIARQELNHSEIIIKKVRNQNISEAALQELITLHDVILAKLV